MSGLPKRIFAWPWEVNPHMGQWATEQQIVGEGAEYVHIEQIAALPEVQAIVTAAESRALDSVTTLHMVIADIRAATVGGKPMLSELSASIAEMREMDRAQAFAAGYQAGVIVERDACATAAYDQLATETEGLGIITAGRVAAAIRKRGEG